MEPAEMTCLLRVNTKTVGWQTAMTQVFQNITGVYAFTIDADDGTAKVSGKVDPGLLLSVLAKSGKHAEIVWVHFDNQPPYSKYMQHGNGYGYYGNNHFDNHPSYSQYMLQDNDNGYYGNNNRYIQYHGGMNHDQHIQHHGGMNHDQHIQYHGGMNHDQQVSLYHQPQPQHLPTPSKPVATYKGLPPVKGKQYNGNVDCCSVM